MFVSTGTELVELLCNVASPSLGPVCALGNIDTCVNRAVQVLRNFVQGIDPVVDARRNFARGSDPVIGALRNFSESLRRRAGGLGRQGGSISQGVWDGASTAVRICWLFCVRGVSTCTPGFAQNRPISDNLIHNQPT